ncbi:MAG TPA: MFS transporter [Symbiobacteriaceae bacterium]|nr:MFS transporter [Symbiobacteriaceae bacterium]
MKQFLLVWVGQLVSLVGSGLTTFALGVTTYQNTGSVTGYALTILCGYLPGILLAPLAGALVDRWERRRTMLAANGALALNVAVLLVLISFDRLAVWHIYASVAVNSAINTFHWSAYTASVALLVPKQHHGRVNGLVQLAQAAVQVLSPVTAALLIPLTGVRGVVLIDLLTFAASFAALTLVRFPDHRAEAASGAAVLQEAWRGFTFVTGRPGLVRLMLTFAAANLLVGIVSVLATPLILRISSQQALGMVMSIGGSGALAGGLVMSAWGGPRRRVDGVLGFLFLAGFAVMVAGLRASPPLFAVAAFAFFFTVPIVAGSANAIWQVKVPIHLQGRVFALVRMALQISFPFAALLAGPLADRVFEPLMAEGGALAPLLGGLLGTGPGRGIGLLFMLMGLLTCSVGVAGYLSPRLRLVEEELPDAA